MQKTSYKTLVDAVNDLERKGYNHEFILDNNRECVVCHQKEISLSPEDFKIDAVFRFYGQSDVDDEAVVYAISSENHKIKGLVVNAFGIYADENANKLIEKLNVYAQKEKTPIKRNKALLKFSQEHHFGLLLCWKIRQGIKNNIALLRIANYIIYFFENDLKKHFEEEEKNVFSKFSINDAKKIQAENEHKYIYSLIHSIKTENYSTDTLIDFANTLEKHIRFEERDFFNYIQQNLPQSELEKLAVLHTHKAIDIDAGWGDRFWEKSK
ncbi:MAG: hypothetical protein JSU07_03015 [Bacteroidetes bacterium]|nr:hypothetical protein [Bacteroidota bacterium]